MAKKQTQVEPLDLDQQLEEFEKKLDRLRATYEQYFLGIEKRPPSAQLREVVRLIRKLGGYHIRKTALKYRLTTLNQRFNVHRAYWQRTSREIEEGTYRKDRARAERRAVRRLGETVDAAELAKRATLLEMKGEAAVEARRLRMKAEGPAPEPQRPAYVPAVARRRLRKKRKKAIEIRGVSAEELVKQQGVQPAAGAESSAPEAALEAHPTAPQQTVFSMPALPAHAASTPVPVTVSPSTPAPTAKGMPTILPQTPPSGVQAPASLGTAGVVGAPQTPFPADHGTQTGLGSLPPGVYRMRPPQNQDGARSAGRSGPPSTRPPLPPRASPKTPPPMPAARDRPAPPENSSAAVLSSAGLTRDRSRQIYERLIEARRRNGQSVASLTFQRILDSMAKQVPRLKEQGASSVDFRVVSKGNRVFLKPIKK